MKTILLGTLVALSLSSAAHAGRNDLLKYNDRWGRNCGNSNSYAIQVQNMRGYAVKARICLEETDGDWSCWVTSINPGEVTDHWGYYVCEGTGRSWWNAVTAGSNDSLGRP